MKARSFDLFWSLGPLGKLWMDTFAQTRLRLAAENQKAGALRGAGTTKKRAAKRHEKIVSAASTEKKGGALPAAKELVKKQRGYSKSTIHRIVGKTNNSKSKKRERS